jgi:hypothetical protein
MAHRTPNVLNHPHSKISLGPNSFIREIRVIHGQILNEKETTDSTDDTDKMVHGTLNVLNHPHTKISLGPSSFIREIRAIRGQIRNRKKTRIARMKRIRCSTNPERVEPSALQNLAQSELFYP